MRVCVCAYTYITPVGKKKQLIWVWKEMLASSVITGDTSGLQSRVHLTQLPIDKGNNMKAQYRIGSVSNS